MAVKALNSGVGNWNMTIPFPKDAYVLHCVGEELGFAGSGSVMITREWEIVSPATITVGENTYNIAGQKITQYLVTKVKAEDKQSWDEAKSAASFSRLAEDLKTLGFEGTEVDDENPPLIAKGKSVDAIVSAKSDVQRKAPTKEMLAKGIKQGEEILVNGKKVTVYNLNINQIVGINNKVKIDSGAF